MPTDDNGWKEIIKGHSEEIRTLREGLDTKMDSLREEHKVTDDKIDKLTSAFAFHKGKMIGISAAVAFVISFAGFILHALDVFG